MRREASLLIVGGNDPLVLELNRQASEFMEAERRLEIIPGASHPFEDPGIDAFARCAAPSTPVMQLIGAPSSCEITHAQ